MTRDSLPVDAHLAAVRDHLAAHRAVIVSAAPGAGKTTRIPPALVDRGPVILLQPRRVAARAVTRRIVDEQGWTLGREAGWQIRYERRSSSETRLLVVTEGILTARLQQDPLLSDFATVIFDEFHERSIHSDIGLALARQAWLARDELNIVIMSATLDVARVSAFLDDAPVVEIPGQLHPTTIEYAPGESMRTAVGSVLPRTSGQILCFLPGAREIETVQSELSTVHAANGVEIVPLHGSLDGEAQDRAIRAAPGRRVILATNIAETSLTVPGVTAVIDSGLHKVVRYGVGRGVDSLTLERVSQESADQRAGRAARLAPGLVRRLWDSRQRLQPHREPEIARLDLAGPVLYLLAWGARIDQFEWFDAPPPERLADALRLLTRLGAVDAHGLTALGRQMQRIPVHPRLARILIDGGGAPEAIRACARLSGDAAYEEPLKRVVAQVLDAPPRRSLDDRQLRHAMFTGYADRLGRRRPDARDRVVLATGHGAIVGRDCEPCEGDFLVALDVVAAERGGHSEALIRSASAVDREWVMPTSIEIEHRYDAAADRVRALRVERYDALTLSEQPVSVDPLVAAEVLTKAWLQHGPNDAALRLARRARFAGQALDVAALARDAAFNARSLADIDLTRQIPYQLARKLEVDAPDHLALPSGRNAHLEYADDGSVSASVKLQELFGLAESPRLGPNQLPVIFHLLAPNKRPVQTTSDLRSFWERTYPEVRKELRGRYPKHPWPEDPWSARPTHRLKPRQ